MEPPWLARPWREPYPSGGPAEIGAHAFASLAELVPPWPFPAGVGCRQVGLPRPPRRSVRPSRTLSMNTERITREA